MNARDSSSSLLSAMFVRDSEHVFGLRNRRSEGGRGVSGAGIPRSLAEVRVEPDEVESEKFEVAAEASPGFIT